MKKMTTGHWLNPSIRADNESLFATIIGICFYISVLPIIFLIILLAKILR